MTTMSSSKMYIELLQPEISSLIVSRFVTHSLRSPDMALQPDSVDQAESAKFQTEFEEFQEKNREQKEAWKKQNPEAAKRLEEEEDWDGIFEDETVRELKTIFQ